MAASGSPQPERRTGSPNFSLDLEITDQIWRTTARSGFWVVWGFARLWAPWLRAVRRIRVLRPQASQCRRGYPQNRILSPGRRGPRANVVPEPGEGPGKRRTE